MNYNEIIHATAKLASQFGLHVEVPASGNANAKCAIVMEAPGEREIAMRTPAVGGAGKMLWDTLRPSGIVRQSLYVTNVCKRQIALSVADKELRNPLGVKEFNLWKNVLIQELSWLENLEYIIVCGSLALKALLGKEGIQKWRGSILPYNDKVTAIVVNNPANALHNPAEEIIFKFHINKAIRILNSGYNPVQIDSIINPTYDDTIDFLQTLDEHAKSSDSPPLVSVDIETASNETACIGIAVRKDVGICIPFVRDVGQVEIGGKVVELVHYFEPEEEVKVRSLIQSVLSKCAVVMQNGVFDSSWLWFKDRMRVFATHDTLLAHHTLYPKLPHNLGFLTTQYTDHPYYKNEKDDWKEVGDLDQFWRYNVKDAVITRIIVEKLIQELKAQGLYKFYTEHVMRLQKHLVSMAVGGILVDTEYKSKVAIELSEQLEELKNQFYQTLYEITGEENYRPSISSVPQMKDMYFRKLRLNGLGVSVDKTSRQYMLNSPSTSEDCKTLIRLHDKIAKEAKFLGTYAEIAIDSDNRIRCEYKQFGTKEAPGRLSSSSTGWGTGSNLQNQPQRAYPMFIADPGFCFVYFDMSQAEARIVAYRAEIPKWIYQFEIARKTGTYDCHRALASEMFNIPYELVPAEDFDSEGNHTKRYIAKRCRHGLNYRMYVETLAEQTGLSLSAAKEAYRLYHAVNPELVLWWDEQISQYTRTKEIFNAMGRRLRLLERVSEDTLKSIIAFYPQSSLGDKVSATIYQCHEDPEWPRKDARIALNIHDALIALCRIEMANDVMEIMKRHAESPMYVEGIHSKEVRPLYIPAEFKISEPDERGIHRWSTLKKVKK